MDHTVVRRRQWNCVRRTLETSGRRNTTPANGRGVGTQRSGVVISVCVLAVRTPEIRNEAEKFVWKGGGGKKRVLPPACSLTLWKECTQLWRTLQNIMKSRLKTILFALALLVLTADGSPSPPLLRSKRQTQCKKKKASDNRDPPFRKFPVALPNLHSFFVQSYLFKNQGVTQDELGKEVPFSPLSSTCFLRLLSVGKPEARGKKRVFVQLVDSLPEAGGKDRGKKDT